MDKTEQAPLQSQPKTSPVRGRLLRVVGAIFLGLVVIVVLVAAVVALQPAEYRVERSAAIAAGPAEVFPHVNDLHKWEAWSPWAKIDPAMDQSYEGAREGTGAIYNWSGNVEVGAGRTTITESHPHDLVRIKLEMFEPMAATNDVKFTFQPQGDQTTVTWTIEGRHNFLGKAVSLVMSMDKMIGDQFEKGLASLKTVVESQKKR
jgi:hypothetical protein